MDEDQGGGSTPPIPKHRKRAEDPLKNGGGSGGGEENDSITYAPYYKPNYKRLYPEHLANTEFTVFVESAEKDKLGNKSPIYLNHIFASEIKGVVAIRRINANKIAVVFKQCNNANNFINNATFLEKYKFKAYIPAAQIERIGIIRFVPANISNKDLFTKLSSIYEIVAVRRFTKKVGQSRVPLQTVSITFLSNSLPDCVQYELFSYRVFDYVPPLQQCFRCFKFNHSAKVCNGKQRCSCCAGEHSYKDCDKPDELCCINCGGPHLAIARTCPIKMKKMLEKKNKITYASVADTKQFDFPPLPEPRQKYYLKQNTSTNVNISSANVNKPTKQTDIQNAPSLNIKAQIMQDNDIIMALVQTLIELGNSPEGKAVNSASIKEMLLKNLSD